MLCDIWLDVVQVGERVLRIQPGFLTGTSSGRVRSSDLYVAMLYS